MVTVKITIDESLPLAKFKTAFSLIRSVSKIEVIKPAIRTEKDEYDALKNVFLRTSKRSMAQQLNKYV
jgi:hypothetical protein